MIKICGIREALLATEAVLSGATMIGLIAHPPSPRHVTLEQAIAIAAATRAAGGIPVAVFVNQTAREMQTFCEATQITCIQLHGENARYAHAHLPDHYQRIFALQPFMTLEGLHTLNVQRDLILADQFPLEKLRDLPFPLLLAGGLTAANVRDQLRQSSAKGVDVSSGVESAPGIKTLELIKSFIRATEENQHA